LSKINSQTIKELQILFLIKINNDKDNTMSSIKITQAVGLGGANNLNDVKVVQTALNKLLKLIPPTKSLIVDGRLGSRPENAKTVAAIKLFQRKVLNMVRPDGKIDANGRTHRKINEKLAGSIGLNIGLTLSVKGINLLKAIENFRSKPYDDQTGSDIRAWVEGATIGYGHLIAKGDWARYSSSITMSDASILFEHDLAPYVRDVRQHVKVALTQQQFDSLVIFTFNIGGSNFKSSSVLTLINDSAALTSYPNLESAWKAWKKSQGIVNKGLVNRRNCEWNIYTKGIYKEW
jgi:GH24 family phage-related lysozyme (muramidase)